MCRFRWLGIAVLCVGLLGLGGCDTEKLAADSTAELFGRAAPGIEQHWDYELVGKSFPASIIQLEGLLRVVPDNEVIGLSLVSAYIGYGTGWIEDRVEVADIEDDWEEADRLRGRALVMYTRAWDLSKHFLRNRDSGFDAALKGGDAGFPYIISDYHIPIMPTKDGKTDWQSGIRDALAPILARVPLYQRDLHGDLLLPLPCRSATTVCRRRATRRRPVRAACP